MLRERRKHANFKPNRRLDRKSSRGMIFENEELRLRTININAEVERGQSYIRKLRRENEQLRRDMWCLRDEYDRLDKALRQNRKDSGSKGTESEDSGESCDTCGEEEEEEEEDEAIEEEVEEEVTRVQESTENEQNNLKANLHVKFDHLSIVSEENLACSGSNSSHNTSPPHNQLISSGLSPPETPDLPRINDLQSVGPPLSHFENIFSSIPYEELEKCLDKPKESSIPKVDLPPASPEARKSPNPGNFQSGGNLEDLLHDIETLSQGILQMQAQSQKNPPSSTPGSPKMARYRSEVNLVLSHGQKSEETQKPDIILMQSEIKPPEPMPILSALYPHQQERRNFLQPPGIVVPSCSKENSFDANLLLAHLPRVSSQILTPKILNAEEGEKKEVTNGEKRMDTLSPSAAAEGDSNREKTPSSADESKRKSRRVSLYFNGKKNEESKDGATNSNKNHTSGTDRISGESSSATPAPAGNSCHHRKNSEVPPTKHKSKKRSHRNSDRNSHNPSSDDALGYLGGERNSLASSRESSASVSTRSQKSRRISINSHAGGKIPWCACWGNGCI